MSEFKREERYIVIKLKHLNSFTEWALRNLLRVNNISTVGGVVVEEDWSIYDDTWRLVEDEFNKNETDKND